MYEEYIKRLVKDAREIREFGVWLPTNEDYLYSGRLAKIKNRTKSSGIIRNEAVRPGTGSPIRRITP
jgi:nitric oxide synthase oxygenase domain/subunit